MTLNIVSPKRKSPPPTRIKYGTVIVTRDMMIVALKLSFSNLEEKIKMVQEANKMVSWYRANLDKKHSHQVSLHYGVNIGSFSKG